MKRRAALGLCGLVLLWPLWAAGQTAGFAGSWSLDIERSDPIQRGGTVPNIDMTVEQSGENLHISRTYLVQGQTYDLRVSYITDGEPREVQTPLGTHLAKAKWKKEKLVVSYTLSRETPQGVFDLDITETWKLSKDGEELRIDYLTRAAQAERSFNRREIYVRE